MDINDYRNKIDQIDEQLVKLFDERMDVAADIAAYKRENNMAVLDPQRERQLLHKISEALPVEKQQSGVLLYSLIMELSRVYQNKLIGKTTDVVEKIRHAIENTPKLFPEMPTVACQGVEGAYAQQACTRLFKVPDIMFVNNFDAVFSAVESGLCDYGVVPLENSTAGSVNKVYDLMLEHKFSIVKSVRLKIDHNLLVNEGTGLYDIKEIYSHEQAINQCAAYLRELKGVKVIPCENTAIAAKRVAESGRKDVAAISSKACAELYNLKCLKDSIQDQGNNYTRFICISKNLEIYPGADRTSLMMTVSHQPGSLYKVLSRFYAMGMNLTKLESRPVPSRNFEFMFYFDLEHSIYSPQFIQLMTELESVCEEYTYLGSYSEVI